MTVLAAATEELYRVFSRYPGKEIEFCHCGCTNPALIERLTATPLETLEPRVVAEYASSATYTIGDANDLRHFLPRMLELAAKREFSSIELEMVTNKLSYNDWNAWPEDERRAIRGFLVAWWEIAVQSGDEEHVTDVLAAIGQAVDDLAPYLARWDPAPGIEQRTILLENAFWEERRDQLAQVRHWLEARG